MTETKHAPGERQIDSIGWRKRLAGTNINPKTLLATDYLNHFNEVVMLLEMLPSMPECVNDIMTWQPKSYPQHFADSNFADRQLAIEAYEHAPQLSRTMLDTVVSHIDEALTELIGRLTANVSEEIAAALAEAPAVAAKIHRLIDLAGSIINGSASQDAVERLEREAATVGEEHFTQDDIDSLFD